MSLKEKSEAIISNDGYGAGSKGTPGNLSQKIDVSIVMTYFERKNQLLNTIKSFSMHGYEGVEVLIIDDGSVEEPVTFEELFLLAPKLDIRVIRIDAAKKNYFNACIPFNMGFAQARGKIIIIQNAECIHIGDVVSYCRKNLDDSKYFSFGCFSIDQEAMIQISNKEKFDRIFLEKYISRNKGVTVDGENGWYNHSVFRPVAYHFTAALTKHNLDLLKGFDIRYANGIGYDDNEILERIRRSEMKIGIIDDVTVLHQWHYSMPKNPRFNKLFTRNRLLLKLVTKREKKISYSRYSIRYMCFLVMLPILSVVVKFVERDKAKSLR
jgi:GT2 family glycosyltransferase